VHDTELRAKARRHLGPHFTRKEAWASEFPVFVRGEGSYLIDSTGQRHLDGLSGLFCVNMGHGRADIARAAADQISTLAYATNWGSAHPSAIEAATLIAGLAPGDLETTFFVNSGSEAVETALKFARQYHRSQGEPDRTKIDQTHSGVNSRNTCLAGRTPLRLQTWAP
jgi:adenosylmethionine-8-amino-7-oxononanoate aminotransferase